MSRTVGAGKTKVIRETGRLDQVNDAIADVKARRVVAQIALESNAVAGVAGGNAKS